MFVLLMTLPSLAVSSDAEVRDADLQTGSSKTVFFDDFGADEIDRSKWNVHVTRDRVVNNELQAYIDSPAVMQTGRAAAKGLDVHDALSIRPLYRSNYRVDSLDRTFDFTSARINTHKKVEFTYGTVAARIKLPAGKGFWPAFWLLGDGRWPDCGEIDILESVGEPEWVGVALHGPDYFGETPLVNRFYFDQPHSSDDWHVYSIDWSRSEIVFRVDDRVTYRVQRAMVEHFGTWAFDTPKHIIINMALGGAYPGKVNGVKQPYYGLPTSTVDKIKAGQGQLLVDWVRVTQTED